MSNDSNSQPDLTPMSNPISDIRKLKRNGQATAAELSGFLAQMRGKSPREVLGAVASSNLMTSFVQATIAVGVLVLILTVIPWGYEKMGGGKDESKAAEVAAAPAETDAPDANADGEAAAPATTADAATAEPPADPAADLLDGKKAAADKMGVTEEKQAPLNVNPLDGSNDDLLKGLE